MRRRAAMAPLQPRQLSLFSLSSPGTLESTAVTVAVNYHQTITTSLTRGWPGGDDGRILCHHSLKFVSLLRHSLSLSPDI
ncbi:hypothetical protein Hanom_Chr08g00705881 [Helianthus anomalus]